LVENGISKEILNGTSTKEISNNISKEIFSIISQTKEIFQITNSKRCLK